VEIRGQLSWRIAIEVVDELLARGLLESRFFCRHGNSMNRTFFALFRFIGIWLLCGFLGCRLLTRNRLRSAGLLLIRVLVVTGHKTC
jgi:hypothetical protein